MKKNLKRILAGTMTACMLAAMWPSAAFAQKADWDYSKSKEAAALTDGLESEVTLSLPSAEEELISDVVFVLDKSSCEKETADEAVALLESLQESIEGTEAAIKVGIVSFRHTGNVVYELTEFSEENVEEIRESIETKPDGTGTNIDGGLLAAKEMLENDTEVADSRKHLILVTDGLARLFSYGDDNATGIIFHEINQDQNTIYAGEFSGWSTTNGIADGSYEIPGDDWDDYFEKISDFVDADGDEYVFDFVEDANQGAWGTNKSNNEKDRELWDFLNSEGNIEKVIPRDDAAEHALSIDRAVYDAYDTYKQLEDKYHCYAVNVNGEDAAPLGKTLVEKMNAYSQNGIEDSDDLASAFDSIQKEIYYLLDAGSVVKDIIGGGTENGFDYDFDFVDDIEKIELTVGGKALDKQTIDDTDATSAYGFGAFNENTEQYDFELYYYENGEDGESDECFIWNIYVPVSNFAPVQLTYTVKLDEVPTEAGKYEFETNKRAVLYPVDSNGYEGEKEEFEIPAVTYKVEGEEPAEPENPDPIAWERSKSKTATALNDTYESTVTLSLPAASYKGDLDVAFVLDGSTSSDEDDLAAQAAELLGELAALENLNVKVSLTVFGGSVPLLEDTDLLGISGDENAENLTNLQNRLIDTVYDSVKDEYGDKARSGSNLQAGVVAAQEKLDKDTAVQAEDKYLVLLSDGAARMWYENGESMHQAYVPDSSIFWNSNEDFIKRYMRADNPLPLREFDEVWTEGQDGANIGAYAMTKEEAKTIAAADAIAEGKAADWNTVANDPDYYTTYEAATYYAATSIVEAAENCRIIFVSYPYNTGTKYGDYSESFKSWLAENEYVTRYDSAEMSETEIFDKVKDELIEVVGPGSRVVDIIGYGTDSEGNAYDFDFIDEISRLELRVGKEVLEGAELADAGDATSAYGFYDAEGNLNFELYYYKDGSGDIAEEHFIWKINVPVTINDTVQLDYDVKLMNPQPKKSTSYTYEDLYTNKKAVLYPIDTEGNAAEPEKFERPEVEYTVGKKSSGGGGGGGSHSTPDKEPEKEPVIPDETPDALNGDDHFDYVVGYPDGKVHPEWNITRAEVAAIFFRLLKEDVRNENVTFENDFPDVPKGMWYTSSVSTMAEMGIAYGRDTGYFDPDDKITRAEFAAIAARFDSQPYSGPDKFSDISGHWAAVHINRAAEKGWIVGYPDGTFKPDQYITRAEAMTLINRVLNRLPESPAALDQDMKHWPDNADTSAWYYLAVQEATNSHEYEKVDNGTYERWTDVLPFRDWARYFYEQNWT